MKRSSMQIALNAKRMSEILIFRKGVRPATSSKFGRPAIFILSLFYKLSTHCNLNMNPSQLTSVTAETSKAMSTRQQNWLPVEDKQLCRSWFSISIDAVVGVDQKRQ
jgi:hypothetical protein